MYKSETSIDEVWWKEIESTKKNKGLFDVEPE